MRPWAVLYRPRDGARGTVRVTPAGKYQYRNPYYMQGLSLCQSSASRQLLIAPFDCKWQKFHISATGAVPPSSRLVVQIVHWPATQCRMDEEEVGEDARLD